MPINGVLRSTIEVCREELNLVDGRIVQINEKTWPKSLQAGIEKIPYGKFALLFIDNTQITGNLRPIIKVIYARQHPKRPDPTILEGDYDATILQNWLWDPKNRRTDVCIIGTKHHCNGIETEIVIYVYPMNCRRCSKSEVDPVIISRSKAMLILSTYQRDHCNCRVPVKSTSASIAKDCQTGNAIASLIKSTGDYQNLRSNPRETKLLMLENFEGNDSYYGALTTALKNLPSDKYALVYFDNSQIMGKLETIIDVIYTNLKRPLPTILEGNHDSKTLTTFLEDPEQRQQDICILGNKHQSMTLETETVVHIHPMDCQKCHYSDANPVVMRQAKEILFMSTFQRFSCHCGFELKPLLENVNEISFFEWKKTLLLSSITLFFIVFVLLPACLLPLLHVSKKDVGKFCI